MTSTASPPVRPAAHDDQVLALAAGLGVLLRRSLPVGGPSVAQVDRRVQRGALRPLRPGAYVGAEAALLPEHRWLTALLTGGRRAVLTGEVACWLQGLTKARRDAEPLVLVQHRARPGGLGQHVVRTTRLPQPRSAATDGLVWPVAPLPRCLADAVRRLAVEPARALVGEALWSGRVQVGEVVHELSAPRARPGAASAVLRDLDAGGVWSVPEGELLDLTRRSCVLPPPQMNVLLVDSRTGSSLLRPDALWWVLALCASVDSREFHEAAQRWSETLDRALTAEVRGLLHVHVTPASIKRRPQATLLVLERHAAARYGCPPPEDMERRTGAGAPAARRDRLGARKNLPQRRQP